VSLGGHIDVPEQGAAGHPRATGVGVDPYLVHPPEIDHDAVVDDRLPGHAVGPATDCDLQPLLEGEPDGGLHVGLVAALRHDERTSVDGRVPYASTLVVRRVVGGDDGSADPASQTGDRTLGCL
jgi:hypothetical protein